MGKIFALHQILDHPTLFWVGVDGWYGVGVGGWYRLVVGGWYRVGVDALGFFLSSSEEFGILTEKVGKNLPTCYLCAARGLMNPQDCKVTFKEAAMRTYFLWKNKSVKLSKE